MQRRWQITSVSVAVLTLLAASQSAGARSTPACAKLAVYESRELPGRPSTEPVRSDTVWFGGDNGAGINTAMAKRVAVLANSVKPEDDIIMTGGVAKNKGVVSTLNVPEDTAGALVVVLDARSGKYYDGKRIPGAQQLAADAPAERLANPERRREARGPIERGGPRQTGHRSRQLTHGHRRRSATSIACDQLRSRVRQAFLTAASGRVQVPEARSQTASMAAPFSAAASRWPISRSSKSCSARATKA